VSLVCRPILHRTGHQVRKKSCRCQQKCLTRFKLDEVLLVCQSFWALKKSSQDALLWSIGGLGRLVAEEFDSSSSSSGSYDSEESEPLGPGSDEESELEFGYTRRTWTFEGLPLCIQRFCNEQFAMVAKVCNVHFCRQVKRFANGPLRCCSVSARIDWLEHRRFSWDVICACWVWLSCIHYLRMLCHLWVACAPQTAR
jgi:hypothetical protein